MAIPLYKGKYPHTGWVDIEGNGVVTEVAVMKNDPSAGLFFIKLNNLDAIDKQRLFRVISNRNSRMYELWDLMSNITLGNGANALDYFHQYVKCLTPSGEVINPSEGRRGFSQPAPRVKARNQEPLEEEGTETVRRTVRKTSTRKKATAPSAAE